MQCHMFTTLLVFFNATCLLLALLLPVSDRSILPLKLLLLSDFCFFYLFLKHIELRLWGLKYVIHSSRSVVVNLTFLSGNKWVLSAKDYISFC